MIEYQRVIAEINLDNIAHNMKLIRNAVNKESMILAVVKADAYGHGAVEVSKVALYNGANWLGVAICDEGIQLRNNNIYVPILILGYTPEPKIEDVINNNLTQTVFSYEMAEAFSNAALKLNKEALVHIKIDTGMGRIGFTPNQEGINQIMKIIKLPNIKVTGIFTHFATSDEKDKSFTYKQYKLFKYVTDSLENNGIKGLIKHVSNSGAILDLEKFSCDMVRAGIILYGMFPSEDVEKNLNLKPAMSFKTHISYVKEIEKGVSIGYGRTFFTERISKIATVPVGYADGYSRTLSNKGRVIIGGKYANVVGNVCMDQFMIDITDIENVKPGDEVILIGSYKSLNISAEEIAEIQSTINYEIVCNIGKRVPRVYIKNNQILKTINYI